MRRKTLFFIALGAKKFSFKSGVLTLIPNRFVNALVINRLPVLLLLFLSFSVNAQNYFTENPSFEQNTEQWRGSGDVAVEWLPEGAVSAGSLQLQVFSTSGRWNGAVLGSSYMDLPKELQGELVVLSFWAKGSGGAREFRVKFYALDSLNNSVSFVSGGYSLSEEFSTYYYPVVLPENAVKFKVDLQCGLSSGKYIFDDFSLEYEERSLQQIRQFDTWQPRFFTVPSLVDYKDLSYDAVSVTSIKINEDSVLAPVLPTQIGVNSNFRSGNSLVERSWLYRQFGAFRFPAGSGSNLYFWDGNVPDEFAIDINAYSGTSGKYLSPENFLEFKDKAVGEPTIVVNYFYARYGLTPDGTRSSRVLQAARYAADWVRYFNKEKKADVKYWEIGNECYGSWETGYNVNGSIVTGEEYGQDFCVFYREMKKVDPNIKIGAVLSHSDMDWNMQVIKQTGDIADFYIIHHYFSDISSQDAIKNNLKALSVDMLEIQALIDNCTMREFGAVPIVLTEYNSQGKHTTSIRNAMFLTELLATVMKYRFSLSTVWVNEWRVSDFTTHGIIALDDPLQADYTPRPSYTPFYYFGKFFGDKLLDVEYDASQLSVYAGSFSSGDWSLSVVNYSDRPQYFKLDYRTLTNKDTLYWYSVYANNDAEGNTKFFVNGYTSESEGGGPENLDSVPAFVTDLWPGKVIEVPAFSVSFFVVKRHQPSTGRGRIKVFPNPAGSVVNVVLDKVGDYKVKWYKIDGKEVTGKVKLINKTGRTVSYDISALDVGLYIVRVNGASAKFYKK